MENLDFLKILSKSFNDRIKYNFNFKLSTEYLTAKQILEKSEDQIYDNILINYADGLISGQKANSLFKKFMELMNSNLYEFKLNAENKINLKLKSNDARQQIKSFINALI